MTTIKEHIDEFLNRFPLMTKIESDLVEVVLKWEDEKKMAFFMAKKIFEAKIDEY